MIGIKMTIWIGCIKVIIRVESSYVNGRVSGNISFDKNYILFKHKLT